MKRRVRKARATPTETPAVVDFRQYARFERLIRHRITRRYEFDWT
ncbi:MAG: hypothetical protein ACYDCQ_01705 [Dehalococcoidia bacterium]